MTKKKGKSSEGGGGGGNNNDASDRKRHEQPLQAVVLAVDWHSGSSKSPTSSSATVVAAFQPLQLDRPKVLWPIVNQTMIDYTINYLCNQGVQELYVVCASYDVEVYVNGIASNHHTSSPSSTAEDEPQYTSFTSTTMKIVVIRDVTITNDGDALREMEQRNVIQSDPFILMYGDTITNVSLPDKIKLYQQYRTTIDTSTISMMLFKSIGTTSPLHSTVANNVIIGFNNNNNTNKKDASSSTSFDIPEATNDCKRILLYDNHSSQKNYVQFPCSFMNQLCHNMMIRTDLYDTGIDICSPELLVRFSDEFDYQNIRNEFVTNTVAEEEIGLQQSIYGCIVSNTEYAARIHNLRIYHHISNDILRRYVYPMVPDNVAITSFQPKPPPTSLAGTSSSLPEILRYSIQNHFMYHQYETLSSTNNNSTYNIVTSSSDHVTRKTKATRIGRTSIVTGPGLIGHNCHIEEHCSIRSSVIGHSCSISNHCTISHSHIWENTIIESNVQIHYSIIASHVVIKSGVTIPRGCIIGSGCVIGINTKLSEYTRLTCAKPDSDNDFNIDDDNDDWDDKDDDNDDDDDKMLDDNQIQNKVSVDDDDDDFVSDVDVVGTDGKGRVWQPPINDNEDDDDDDDEPMQEGTEQIVTTNDIAIKCQCIGYDIINFSSDRVPHQDYEDDDDSFSDNDEYNDHEIGNRPYDDDDFDDDDDYNDDNGDHITFGEPVHSATGTTTTAATIIGRQDGVDVVKELKLICLEYEGGSIDNLGIELNSYKFSQNATYADCTMAAIMAIIEKIHITSKMSDGKLISEFKSSIEQWSSLLIKMCIGTEEEKAIVLGLERCCIGDSTIPENVDTSNQEQVMKLSSGMSFRLLLQTLHDEEIVSEEAILLWANERRNEIVSDEDEQMIRTGGLNNVHLTLKERRLQLFRLQPIQDFLEWLEDGDDEDDEEEEEEDDEDDDE